MSKRQDYSLNRVQACILIFLVAIGVRISTLNDMGLTWDEPAYVSTGYKYVQLIRDRNFSDPFWYELADHPPLIRYVYGFAGMLDIKSEHAGIAQYHYSFTFARLVSALLGSLSAVFIVLIGYEYFSKFIGFSSGLIFSLIPFFVGLSQLATLESFMMFFFTGAVYFCLRFLKTGAVGTGVVTGIFAGMSLLVKQSNVIIFPLIACFGVLHFFFQERKSVKSARAYVVGFLIIGVSALLSVFLLWPMPFFHMKETWAVQQTMWVDAVKLPPPEVFFGRLMLVPFPYYIVMFLITTPILILLLSFLGFIHVDKKRNFISFAILIWLLFPFLQSFYAFKQHGVRYIIEIYAPFAILCGLGISYVSQWFGKGRIVKPSILAVVVVYLFLILLKVKPYYLDYFNEAVGGNKNVYEKKLFQMGWWGQGIGEAAYYISRSEGKNVTVAVDGGQPMIVMPNLKNISAVDYNTNKNADYVIVPYFNVARLWFPEHELIGKYEVVHTVTVDSVPLVKVYKKKFPKLNY